MKYTFQATYKDGTTYVQNQEDVSLTDSTKSCYFDIKVEEVKTFFLFDEKNTYSVSLEDGHFEVNGVPFFMHEETYLKDFRLIYFRQHTHSFNRDTNAEISHDIVFRFGWQCEVNGKNYQQVMEIN